MTMQSEIGSTALESFAVANRNALRNAQVLGVQFCGSAGSGKTALLEVTSRHLMGRARLGVIVAHRAAQRDANQLRHNALVVACETRQVTPQMVHDAIRQLDLHDLDILFIETPDEEPIDLGESARVALFSITGGDDKAVEFPQRVIGADLVLLNKTDLLPLVKFDPRLFRSDVVQLNPRAELIEISSRDGSGIDSWARWLLDRWQNLQSDNAPTPSMPEWWFG